MTTSRRPRPRPAAKPAPDPNVLLAKLRLRLDRERAVLGHGQQRLLRVFHAWEKQVRLVARLERRIARLECAPDPAGDYTAAEQTGARPRQPKRRAREQP